MNRNISLDILKLAMAFMVVGLHSGFLNEVSSLASFLAVNGVFRIAVPIFLLINGYFFFPVLEGDRTRTWFRKLLTLYIVWMAFYSYFWAISPFGAEGYFISLVVSIVFGYHHLWYISGMIGAALVLVLLKNLPSKNLAVVVALTAIAGVAIQYCRNYHVFSGTSLDTVFSYYELHRNFLLFSFPFFCMGFLINKHSLHKRVEKNHLVVLGILGVIFLGFESYLDFYSEVGRADYDNYGSLLLLCPVVFIFFMRTNISGQSKDIALYSSAIYFIHSFFLSLFRKVTDFEGSMLTLLVILTSIAASFFIIRLNRKFKFLL